LDLIKDYENNVVVTMTGTIEYETEIAIATLNAKKHLITMNMELQATVGTELKRIADQHGVIITDVIGDQPGSLARFMAQVKLMGFKPILAGNMKRFLNLHATQATMKSWADNKGLQVRKVTSYTDGTKQSFELSVVANYFGMKVTQFGMKGPALENIKDVLTAFDWEALPREGAVDYVIGKNLFPGIFVVGEHLDPHQTSYLQYLSLGDGPRYVLFEPYHLCHLEVPLTIANIVFFGQETINNGLNPRTRTVAVSKFDVQKGQILDGIGGDCAYGAVDNIESSDDFLPMGFTDGAVVKRNIPQDTPLELSDVTLPSNTATRLAGLV
jgi:predicted homoserine dehydrogenase-like protein